MQTSYGTALGKIKANRFVTCETPGRMVIRQSVSNDSGYVIGVSCHDAEDGQNIAFIGLNELTDGFGVEIGPYEVQDGDYIVPDDEGRGIPARLVCPPTLGINVGDTTKTADRVG
jgi:hypothetical protein